MTDISITSEDAALVQPSTRRDHRLRRVAIALTVVTVGLAKANVVDRPV